MGGLTTAKGGSPAATLPRQSVPDYVSAARDNLARQAPSTADPRRASDAPAYRSDNGSGFLDPMNPLSPISPFNPVGIFSQSYSDSSDSGTSSCSSSYDSGSSSSSDCGSSSSYGGD